MPDSELSIAAKSSPLSSLQPCGADAVSTTIPILLRKVLRLREVGNFPEVTQLVGFEARSF